MKSSSVPIAAVGVSRASPCTCLRLRKLSRQMTVLYDQQLAPFGLTVTQFSLLAHLRALNGVGIGVLAEAMVMDPTALTRALRPLERAGLVQVACDAADRRSRQLRLTQQGRIVYEAARPGWRRAQQQVNRVLAATDMPGLNGLLDSLIDRMKSQSDPLETALDNQEMETP